MPLGMPWLPLSENPDHHPKKKQKTKTNKNKNEPFSH
jgi:hypothetical protein